MERLPPIPPFPPTESFLPQPWEPDEAAELRARINLKLFRSMATSLERIQRLLHPPVPEVWHEVLELPKLPPELEQKLAKVRREMSGPGGLWSPEAVEERRRAFEPVINQMKGQVKERLLALEGAFIDKGWRLPKWKRPSWLLE